MPLLGVSFAGGPLHEGHSAARGGTDEGFLSGVKSPVVVESVPLSEGPAAELTGVLLHAGVHVHVVLETGAPIEPLPALFTHVGLDTGVLHGVELQFAPVMEGGVTVFTGELLAQLWIVDVELVFLSQLEIENVGRDSLLFEENLPSLSETPSHSGCT